ncbi:MAG: stabilization protein [Podoviridae sp. ctrTa16]|nr:MAG: stabilization protein [Podoviridae sp. ctrTa16]
MTYTLTYSELVQGWPSFYSFYPDWMIGMNNFFYSFKGGNLYKHNTNIDRNTFYLDWWTRLGAPENAFTDSNVISVFNDAPLENKLFKTINLEGDDSWSATLHTDIQTTGFTISNWFEKKEGAFFSFIRNTGTVPAGADEYVLRSANGIGKSLSIDPSIPAATEVNFQITPFPVMIGSILSVGDYLYYLLPPYTTPQLFGKVMDINVDLRAGINRIIVDASITYATVPGIQDPYIMFIKDSIAESHGVLGHYCVFNITNSNISKVELFAVQSDVMKSYP